jgi:hypothetical protein
MPKRPAPETKNYEPRETVNCEVCGLEFYKGYKDTHINSKRHLLCLSAIHRYKERIITKWLI